MKKTLVTFKVDYLQILNEKGDVDSKLMPKLANEDIRKMYRMMVLSRLFNDKMLKLQRQGRLGTLASLKGQEAAQIGSAYALQPMDMMFPSFREHGVYLARGLSMSGLLVGMAGDERGQRVPDGSQNFMMSVPVGTHPLHATGYAWGMKMRKKNVATITYFGDGATSEGDFHEAMNFAGTFQAPVVFFNQNNQWAISVPRSRQTHAQTTAQKAIAYGFDGIQVDGNDVFAVYKATKDALDKARKGGGPTFIEAYTYRMDDHTTADASARYRDQKEVDAWAKKDPIDRLRKYMEKKKLWSKKDEEKLLADCTMQIEAAVAEAEKIPPPDPMEMFTSMYAEPTPLLKDEMDELRGR
ncbi:pyruvate dehydrogenase (acetyl-transferring) E1 component subunit alpha [Candidatus Woesearchaeota archaeon]|nr:pyruvate dehydrogenase (acetyl-transferring) E1 component subunit alpha [Candidatus Woesearchaeota archaeon]